MITNDKPTDAEKPDAKNMPSARIKLYPNQPKCNVVLFQQRPTEYIYSVRHLVSPSSSEGKYELVGFGNPEEHIPVLTDSIVFGFEAIHDFPSLVCKFTLAFNNFMHSGVDRSDIELPIFFRRSKMP